MQQIYLIESRSQKYEANIIELNHHSSFESKEYLSDYVIFKSNWDMYPMNEL